jgi:UDP-glucose 4-epimerase
MTAGSGLLLNIGTGVASSVNSLWRELVAGIDLQPIYEPAREGDIRTSRLDSSLASRELDWTAKTSLQEGLAKMRDDRQQPDQGRDQ